MLSVDQVKIDFHTQTRKEETKVRERECKEGGRKKVGGESVKCEHLKSYWTGQSECGKLRNACACKSIGACSGKPEVRRKRAGGKEGGEREKKQLLCREALCNVKLKPEVTKRGWKNSSENENKESNVLLVGSTKAQWPTRSKSNGS